MQMTPKEIVAELDKYIIGQDDAKRAVAISLRNRWRRQQVSAELREEIMPNNIILIGPTGVGKTELARRLARLAGAPFIKVEASKFSEVGYVGRDVESIIRDLLDLSVNMVRSEFTENVQEKASELAKERVLDILFPIPELPQATNEHDLEKNEELEKKRNRTREKLRKKLEAKELDDKSSRSKLPANNLH